MRRSIIAATLLIAYPLGEAAALPKHCPKIDQAMLKADASSLGIGGELEMDGYVWKVAGGNLCNPTCGSEYEQSLQKGVKIKSNFKLLKPEGAVECNYAMVREEATVADLVMMTDESKKLPAHSIKRWKELSNKVDKAMEEESRQYRDEPRIRME